jgi:hypothetical protein
MSDLKLECLQIAVKHAGTYDQALKIAEEMHAFMTAGEQLPVIEAVLNVDLINAKIHAAKHVPAVALEAAFGAGEGKDTFTNASPGA